MKLLDALAASTVDKGVYIKDGQPFWATFSSKDFQMSLDPNDVQLSESEIQGVDWFPVYVEDGKEYYVINRIKEPIEEIRDTVNEMWRHMRPQEYRNMGTDKEIE